MWLLTWLLDQKLSDWVQGLGSLAAAGAAVGIALRQERTERLRADDARTLRRQVLAAAIAPVPKDLSTTARLRNGLMQTMGRARQDEPRPRAEELLIPMPDILMTTLDRIDVFGAATAARVYMLIHRVNDYNRAVESLREWDVPVRSWTINLRPKLDAVTAVLDALQPPIDREVDGLEQPRA
jgi:hypothetical protein